MNPTPGEPSLSPVPDWFRGMAGTMAALVAVWLVPLAFYGSLIAIEADPLRVRRWLVESPGLAAVQVVILEGILLLVALGISGKKILARPSTSRRSALLLVVAFLSGCCLSVLLTEAAHVLITWAPAVFKADVLLGIADRLRAPSAGTAGLVLALAAAAPLGEEILCRGTVLGGFTRPLGRPGAVLASAAIFGLLHGDPTQGICAAIFGVYAGSLALRFGSVWPAVAAHAGVNLADSAAVVVGWVDARQALERGLPTWAIGLAAAVAVGCVGLLYPSRLFGRVDREISDPR